MKRIKYSAAFASVLLTAALLRAVPVGTTDLAGNALAGLPYTSGETYILDASAPSAPTGLDLDAASDSGNSATDNLTNDTTPTINGSGEVGATVALYDTDGTTALGSATVTGSGTWSITASALAAGEHTLTAKQSDAAGNVSDASEGLAIVIDISAPAATGSVRASGNPTNAGSVQFTVTFNEDVTGVTLDDLGLMPPATSGASITSVSGSNKTYTVTVDTGSGSGTIKLNVHHSSGIVDVAGNSLSGSFSSGEHYTIDKTAPTVTSISRQAGTNVNAGTDDLVFRVLFSDANTVSGVDGSDFVLTTANGTATGEVASVASAGSNAFDVTIDHVAGIGSLKLDLKGTGTGIVDAAGNPIGGGFSAGDIYLVGTANVFETTIIPGVVGKTVGFDLAVAQPFRTSANGPMTVYHVAAQIGTVMDDPAAVVSIHSDDDGAPGAVIAVLNNPQTLQPNALNVWTTATTLNADSAYWLVFSNDSEVSLDGFFVVVATNTTTGGAGDWLNPSPYEFAEFFDSWETGAGALRIAIGAVSSAAITGVTAPANAAYRATQHLDFTVSYDTPVAVDVDGGTPRLALTVGSSTVYADYVSGSPGTELLFRYTVDANDTDVDGIAVVSPIQLNDGTIKGAADIDALLTFSAPDTSGVRVDNTAPTVAGVSSSAANASYKAGDTVAIIVTFSEAVNVSGTPTLALNSSGSASYVDGSGTAALTFDYTIAAGNTSADLDYVATDSLALSGGTIIDVAGHAATLTLPQVGSGSSLGGQKNLVIDGVAPTVSSVDVPSNGTMKAGANLDFTVNFTEAVTITGSPYLGVELETGGTVQAVYEAGSGTSAVLFRYVVGANTADANGIELAESLTLNGGTIRDAAGNNATLSLDDVAATTGVLVDGVAPAVTSIERSGAALTNASTVEFTVTFSENVSGVSTDDFALTTDLFAASVTGLSGSGAVYTVVVDLGTGSGTLRLDLESSGTGIADAPGNAIATGFTAGEHYTIDRDAPTIVSIERQAPITINSEAISLTWRVTFAKDVTGVDATDFVLTTVDGSAAGVLGTATAISASVYEIPVTSVSGRGRLRLDLKSTGTGIADLASNALADGAFTDGEFYLAGIPNVFQSTHLNATGEASVSKNASMRAAQRFTTAADAPLSVTTVTAAIGSIAGPVSPVVTIHQAESNGGVGELVVMLTNPQVLTQNALNVWTGAQQLSPDTTYWLVFADESEFGSYEVGITASTEDGIGSWIGENDYRFRQGHDLTALDQFAGALSVAIGATSVPTITSGLTADGTYGTAFAGYTIAATNLPTSFAATDLPAGLAFDAETGVISGTPTQSGTFNVKLGATNTSGTGPESTLVLTIAKAPLTATADAATRVYGAANPAFTVSYSGFVNDDTATALTTAPSLNTPAIETSPVGEYAIVPSGGSAANYTLSHSNGVLTVTKATATVTLDDLTRSYTGAAQVVTATTDPVGLTVDITYNGSVTAPSAPGSYTVAAAIADTNYQGTASGTLNIGKSPVAITLAGLEVVYDGTPKAVTATAAGGLPVAVTYSGSGMAPVNAGNYAVVASVDTATQSGSATGTLKIAKATQTIAFALADLNLGSVNLAATASSGLPVTFAVVSGPATVAGAKLTVTGSGTVTVRASQAGNTNYEPAMVEHTVAVSGKLAQTITFPEIAERTTLDGAFRLVATASSGLPVKFTVVSGPAMVAGRSLVLNGTAGTVVLRASQAGNDIYGAAVDVERSFEVRDAATNTFFGDLTSGASAASQVKAFSLSTDGEEPVKAKAAKVGDIAASFTPGVGRGTLMIVAGSIGLNVVLDFSLEDDGSYSISFSNAGESLTVVGALVGNRLDGEIPQLNLNFSTQTDLVGSTAAFAGFYQSDALETAQGVTYSIVGSNGQALVLVVTPTVVTGGMTQVSDDGSFALTTSAATVTGAINAPASTVTGAITIPGQPQVGFSGLRDLVLRTDRLINLSSRARVGSGARTLITGFVIGGEEPKTLLLRAAGPALNPVGISTPLSDPQLHVFNQEGTLIAQNDNWSGADVVEASNRAGAFAFSEGSLDAALVTTLEPGIYTMHVSGREESGVAVAEVYDASENPEGEYQRLINISSRGDVGTGDNVLIGGFVVTGNAPKRVLVRGVGPALSAAGVPDALADPVVRVFEGSTVIGANDNWSSDPAAAADVVEATMISGAGQLESGSRDAAMILTLAPGVYTVHVSGQAGSTGIAIVEIYEIPE